MVARKARTYRTRKSTMMNRVWGFFSRARALVKPSKRKKEKKKDKPPSLSRGSRAIVPLKRNVLKLRKSSTKKRYFFLNPKEIFVTFKRCNLHLRILLPT